VVGVAGALVLRAGPVDHPAVRADPLQRGAVALHYRQAPELEQACKVAMSEAARFDDRFGKHHDAALDSVDLLRQRAGEIFAEHAFEFWRFTFDSDRLAIKPGRRVFYTNATVGVAPSTDFGQVYKVAETEDRYARGRWWRRLTLREMPE
jgi:hypothetical protein